MEITTRRIWLEYWQQRLTRTVNVKRAERYIRRIKRMLRARQLLLPFRRTR